MITVTNDYSIKVDDNCYIVVRRVNKKDGTGDDFVPSTFHPNFTSALEKIMRTAQMKELSKKDMDLQEALKIMKGINETFRGIMQRYVEEYEKVR